MADAAQPRSDCDAAGREIDRGCPALKTTAVLPIKHIVTLAIPSTAVAACTVVTADYLPWVRVTADSFMDHHPGAQFLVLVIDEPAPSQLRGEDQFTVVRPADVGLSVDELAWMDLIYTPVELCCALKPWLVRMTLDHCEVALYIDADMCVYAPLTEVASQARDVDLVLSPHSLHPRTDPRMPDDDALLQFGQFNGGFLAVSRKGREFADWWAAKCARECTDWNPEVPRRYLDQRWLDLAIGYFDARVTRDPGINLARWNMYQRDFDMVDGRFVVDDGPLRTFHFSAFNPADPANIRREGYTHPKVDPAENEALGHLLQDYADRLIAAGWSSPGARSGPRQVAGIAVTPAVRSAIRASLEDAERLRAVPADAASDPARLLQWLRSPVSPDGVPWFLWGLRAVTPVIKNTFPHVPGADSSRYLEWAADQGVQSGLVPPALFATAPPAPSAPPALESPSPAAVVGSPASAVESPTPAPAVNDQSATLDEVAPAADTAAQPPPPGAHPSHPRVSQELLDFTAECRFERQSILDAALRVAEELPPGSRLIDVGAGNSPYRELFTHLRYESTDWQHSPHPGARAVDHVGPAHELPVGDGEYDAVLCTQVLEHVPNPLQVLEELNRVLRPGGRLYMTMPLAWELHELPFDFFRYTPHGLATLLGDAGFSKLDIRPRNDCFQTLAQLLTNAYSMVGSAPDGRDPQRAEAVSALREMSERVAGYAGLDTRWIFPLGYSVAAIKSGDESLDTRAHGEELLTARQTVGLEQARGHVTLCFGSDVLFDSRLIAAYAGHFSATDDATLAIYVPDADVDLAAKRIVEVVTRLGLEGLDAVDMIGLPFSGRPDEPTLARAVDAVLSLTPPAGAFAGLPWAHPGTLEQIASQLPVTHT